jgi:uncharacterized SAM-dependent methyltransferase
MEYLYFICTLPIALIALLLIYDLSNDRQNARRYQEYIDSIRVGDIFEPNFLEDLNDDPFDEVIDYTEYSKVIVDIKKNNKGETWVKYKRLNCDVEFTQEIHRFVKDHKIVTSNLKSDSVCCQPKKTEIKRNQQ